MKRILFLMMPLGGHVYPNIKLLEELSRRQIQILVFCDKRYKNAIPSENIVFNSYPKEVLQFCNEMGPVTHNKQEAADHYFSFLTDSSLALLRIFEEVKQGDVFLKQCLDTIKAFHPEVILYDSQVTFARKLLQLMDCPIIELNCSAYIPLLQKSKSFQKYYEKIVRKEASNHMTYDGLLNLQRKISRKTGQEEIKKNCIMHITHLCFRMNLN
jgi:UDP:flavonoid glycosyltransferase YjiC (YdhE family)